MTEGTAVSDEPTITVDGEQVRGIIVGETRPILDPVPAEVPWERYIPGAVTWTVETDRYYEGGTEHTIEAHGCTGRAVVIANPGGGSRLLGTTALTTT